MNISEKHDDSHPLKAPVLFLVFNRPGVTAQVFSAIRAAAPARLYIAADGPRDIPGEERLCEQTRRIAVAVDWPCEVRTLFRRQNLGCRAAVSGAISWFFEQEEAGIILEDDCLPSASFFPYCEELLERYHDDERVMSIGGSNFQAGRVRGAASYFATKHFHCWGWASWRRAWAEYNGELNGIDGSLQRGLALLSDGSASFASYWRQIYSACRRGSVSSWAYPMSLTCFARTGAGRETLHLAPQVNLVANLGFGGGTHTRDFANPAACHGNLDGPIMHPRALVRDAEADRYTDQTHFHVSWPTILKRGMYGVAARLGRTWRR